jgi:hypothetical protein
MARGRVNSALASDAGTRGVCGLSASAKHEVAVDVDAADESKNHMSVDATRALLFLGVNEEQRRS